MGESSHDSTLEQNGKLIEEILNHLDELPLDRIERIEDDVEGLNKGKEIAKLITPPSETASEEDNDPEQAQRDKDMEFGHFAKECRKLKRVKDSAYHKEKMLLCKQAEQGVPLQAEQYDWLVDTDEEVDEQELEAHYSYMAKIQEAVFEKYKAFNDRTIDYEKLKLKLSEALRQLAQKDTVIREVSKANVLEGLSKPVTIQTLSQTAKKAVSNTNVLKQGMYRIDNRISHTRAPQLPQTVKNTNPRVSTSTRVNHNTNVSRPQLKRNQSRDKVLPNNSQVKAKKTQVEVHPRIPSVSNKMMSITACKDNLNSRTWNANVVCATCNKCLVDSNHFACVTKMLNDVHARTKKHNFVPILGYGDLVQGNVMINRVYYVEGLNHNIFSVGQFCDANLKVAFRKLTCFVRDLQGNDLLTGNRGSDLYTISLQESTSTTPLCLMAKAIPTQAWL
nr:retrovirus-related Pol polyprotein from transposon TNT 1-94 [Tanacetum cinerariifolium]